MFLLVALTVLMNIPAFHNAMSALWARIGGMIGRKTGAS